MNNFYYTTVAGGPPTPLSATIDAVDLWDTLNAAKYTNSMSNEVNNLTIRGQIIQPNGTNNPTRFMFYEAPMSIEQGAVVGNALPSSVAGVVRKRTAFSGRQFRGRSYVPGIPVAWELDSVLTAVGADTLLQQFGDLILTTLAGGVIQWDPIVTNAPSFTVQTVINAVAVDPVLRIQRRREVGVGE